MQRRGRILPNEALAELSVRAGLAMRLPNGSFAPAEIIARQGPQSHVHLAEDAVVPAGLLSSEERWPRARVDRVFQRGIKRTLGLEHYEAHGFFGGWPVEVYSTSPWHALEARRFLGSRPAASQPFRQTVRIYHEPFGKFSEHCPRSTLPEILLLDPEEVRALIVGSLAAADLTLALEALAGASAP
jgi:hypothetical protein